MGKDFIIVDDKDIPTPIGLTNREGAYWGQIYVGAINDEQLPEVAAIQADKALANRREFIQREQEEAPPELG